jgi:hypothetical protein
VKLRLVNKFWRGAATALLNKNHSIRPVVIDKKKCPVFKMFRTMKSLEDFPITRFKLDLSTLYLKDVRTFLKRFGPCIEELGTCKPDVWDYNYGSGKSILGKFKAVLTNAPQHLKTLKLHKIPPALLVALKREDLKFPELKKLVIQHGDPFLYTPHLEFYENIFLACPNLKSLKTNIEMRNFNLSGTSESVAQNMESLAGHFENLKFGELRLVNVNAMRFAPMKFLDLLAAKGLKFRSLGFGLEMKESTDGPSLLKFLTLQGDILERLELHYNTSREDKLEFPHLKSLKTLTIRNVRNESKSSLFGPVSSVQVPKLEKVETSIDLFQDYFGERADTYVTVRSCVITPFKSSRSPPLNREEFLNKISIRFPNLTHLKLQCKIRKRQLKTILARFPDLIELDFFYSSMSVGIEDYGMSINPIICGFPEELSAWLQRNYMALCAKEDLQGFYKATQVLKQNLLPSLWDFRRKWLWNKFLVLIVKWLQLQCQRLYFRISIRFCSRNRLSVPSIFKKIQIII